MKTICIFIVFLNFFNFKAQEINCNIEQTKDFKEFKTIYSNIDVDDYRSHLDNNYSNSDTELILLKKPDRFKGELTVFAIKNDKIFGYKKDTSKVIYVTIHQQDFELVNENLSQLKNNFYVNFCNNKETHSNIYLLIVRKKGKVVSGYFSVNLLEFRTKNENQDLSILYNLMSILHRYSFFK
ncbi:hypothetical protein [Chryseobacterium caseinilyticum]|uniref:DUF4252 domain-containing protein n=1 Tax=Chryseobacterium caseinilyticum TaxID=2771428 RepID=A0ABR8Z7S4_9FLAO|nr:hypothetical protein [Chryseobacterium caseinilyticum]MBD8080938.1 hypothetical protein [Chryseobacterium caseinilyticum]